MNTHAVIALQGKQYIVKKDDDITVERVKGEVGDEIEIPVLLYINSTDETVEFPKKGDSAKGKIVENMKGDKIRVAKYKSKVRYRKVRGFRQSLTKISVTQL